MFALLKNAWLKFDNFLLSKCQNFSDKVYEKTGRSNFAPAKIFLHLALLANFAMLSMIVQLREYLTDFGKYLFCSQAAATYIIFICLSLEIKIIGLLAAESLYDNSEELKVIITKWKQWFLFHRLMYFGSSLLLIGSTVWFLMTTEISGNPFSNPILSYTYLSMMIIPFFSISAYFASCKTILPIKGHVALMVSG